MPTGCANCARACSSAQFGGAAGTLASLGEGEEAVATRTELARELALGDPPITWHVARDGIAETVQVLALRRRQPRQDRLST